MNLQELENVSVNICTVLLVAVIGISNLFVYCYFGKMSSESFERMAISLSEANWCSLPIELQKWFVIVIGMIQKPVCYHGLGRQFLNLNLETFNEVSDENFVLNFSLKNDLN